LKRGSDGDPCTNADDGAGGGALLLAAGFSRRFGSDKRRHRLADGSSLLAASVALYSQAFPKLIVVLRPGDDDLAAEVRASANDSNVQIVFCADALEGMGRSLAAGAAAAQGWDYLFVALADMPWVSLDTLRHLRREMQGAGSDSIILPVKGNQPGHPVGFGADYLPALATLTGDQGARSLVREAGNRTHRVIVEDAGVLQDLDTPPA
jgi:molybdenum cofactor cytidylyltransferase